MRKEVSVDVTSAVELTAEQVTTLSAALEKRLARKVKLNCECRCKRSLWFSN